MLCRKNCIILVSIVTLIGIIFGISEATMWSFGLIPSIRAIIPYATADALLIVALTTLIALFYREGNSQESDCCEDKSIQSSSRCLLNFVSVITIAAAVFLIFIQIFVGTVLPLTLKVILAFVGSISFWIMFVVFIAFVIWIVRKR